MPLDHLKDIVPQVAGTITWITFGGLPNESSSAFVQYLQRIGFQQGRGRDDGWMAEYAATCFEVDALAWYTELDDEVQESWKKLRTNLLRKYPPVAGSSPSLFTVPHPTTVPAAPAGGFSSSTNPNQSHGPVGRIELVTNIGAPRGYLCFEPTSGIDITTDKDKAAIVSVQASMVSGISLLAMLRSSDRVFPYLGLALHVPQGKDPNLVPGMLPGICRLDPLVFGGRPWTNGVPKPSSVCKGLALTDYSDISSVEFATWTFSACGETKKGVLHRRRSDTRVPGRRAVAAVWKYDSTTEEFKMFWLMDDDTECELGGYVRKGTSDKLHAHRISDMDRVGKYITEERVRLAFDRTQ